MFSKERNTVLNFARPILYYHQRFPGIFSGKSFKNRKPNVSREYFPACLTHLTSTAPPERIRRRLLWRCQETPPFQTVVAHLRPDRRSHYGGVHLGGQHKVPGSIHFIDLDDGVIWNIYLWFLCIEHHHHSWIINVALLRKHNSWQLQPSPKYDHLNCTILFLPQKYLKILDWTLRTIPCKTVYNNESFFRLCFQYCKWLFS